MNTSGETRIQDRKFRQALECFNTNNYNDAVRILLDITRSHPRYYPAYNLAGIIQRLQGNLRDAMDSFMKALSIKPDFQDARKNLQ